MEYFVLMEVGKKQGYIFKGNGLKENIGASMIIRDVTEKLPKDKLVKYSGEKILSGGGKGLFKFSKEELATSFIKELSKKILKNFKGLNVYFVKSEVDLQKDNVIIKIEELYTKIAKKKAKRLNTIGQVSLGIEAVCESTGLPVTSSSDKNISEEIHSKINYYDANKDYYLTRDNIMYENENDKFKGEDKSYISIIHIDGNSMGNKFSDLAYFYKNKINNDRKYNIEYLTALSKLSKEIDKIYLDAFYKVKNESIEEGVCSIRPIVVAGDDITFMSKAGNAIKLAKVFIDSIKESKVNIGEKEVKLNAAAGIAFVKSHYPFNKGYELAEELTANCKMKIKEERIDASAIDWHIVDGEDYRSIQELRAYKYNAKGLKLNLRPIFIDEERLESYKVFKDTLAKINKCKIPRSKVKALREEMANGEEAMKKYIHYYNLEDKIDWAASMKCDLGIRDNTAVFFDAIEIMDIVKEV